jgi:dTDP-4-dehydrorhamnose reductase
MADLLVLGGTGMLGRAIVDTARARGFDCVSAARRRADIDLDLGEPSGWRKALAQAAPRVVVNSAAIADVDSCDRDPARAEIVNGHAPGELASLCRSLGIRFVQISTDHFFTGDADAKHSEDAPISILNAYAASKRLGEQTTARVPGVLVLRTNVTGWRGEAARPTFVEWACETLRLGKPARLFDDYFTSTIHAAGFAQAMIELVELGADGLYNVASSEVSSKMAFVAALAHALSLPCANLSRGSVKDLGVRRAESCGLNVTKAELALGRRLPDLKTVVDSLVKEKA